MPKANQRVVVIHYIYSVNHFYSLMKYIYIFIKTANAPGLIATVAKVTDSLKKKKEKRSTRRVADIE